MYMHYAEQKCPKEEFKDACKAPNGYEPRFDSEGTGAKKHFPRTPCLNEVWHDLEAMEVIDKSTETDYAGWLKNRANARCRDNNQGIFFDSDQQVQNCAAAADFCQDATHGKTARKNCPKTCGLCSKPTSGLLQEEIELDDAVAGKAAFFRALGHSHQRQHIGLTLQRQTKLVLSILSRLTAAAWPRSNETAETKASASRSRLSP